MNQRNWKPSILFTSFGLGLMISFQNCSRAKFSTNEGSPLSSVGADTGTSNTTGTTATTGTTGATNTQKCPSNQIQDLAGNCISSVAISSSCTLNGQLIGNNSTITAYQTSSVAAGSQCVYESRICRNGILSGSFSNLACQPLSREPANSGPSTSSPAAPSPSTQPTNTVPAVTCTFNGKQIKSGGEPVTAYLTSSGPTCQSEQRSCTSTGSLTGSYLYASCTPTAVPTSRPTCNSIEAGTVQRTFTQIIRTTKYDVAFNCKDQVTPTVEASYPTSIARYLRFMNTCGNRACMNKGFLSGRVVEINNDDVQLECRTDQVAPSVSNSCQQLVSSLPKPIEKIDLPDADIALACGLSSPPSTDDQLTDWVYTCGNRACVKRGFSAGRIIEYYNGISKLECTREEVLNRLDAGTLMNVVNASVQAVATACRDEANPAVADSYPTNGVGQKIRFYNTCGRRYCRDQKYDSGRVTEVSGQNVQLICVH
jgi:hypothetical protein